MPGAPLTDPDVEEFVPISEENLAYLGSEADRLWTQTDKAILANFGGTQSGLPFIVFLNKKGKMIANSNVMPENQNIGYPGSKEEIAAFIKLLKLSAPHMTDEQRTVISEYLEKNAPQ